MLVAEREPAHTAHDAQDVVVDGVDAHVPVVVIALAYAHATGHLHDDGGRIDAREVAGARRLVLLGAQRERVGVDAGLITVSCVVLELLYLVEVVSVALRHTVLSVDLDELLVYCVTVVGERLEAGQTSPLSKVAVRVFGGLDHPDEFLYGMVKSQVNSVVIG